MSASAPRVREFGPEDGPPVACLAREAGLSLDLQAIERHPHQQLHVLVHEGAVVAFVSSTWLGSEVEISDLAVSGDLRRRGLGRALLLGFFDILRRRGVKRVLLEVSADNRPARTLYGAVGFAEVGRRASYYETGQDAILLDRCLLQAD